MTSPAGVRGRPGSKDEHAVRVRRRHRLAALCIPHRKRLVTLLSRVRPLPARIKTEIRVSEKSEVRALGGYDVHALPGPHPPVHGSNARLVDVHNPEIS